MPMNNKKILAVSISAVLTVGFLAPSLMNAQAQVSSESRVLNTILALTEDINRKAQTVHNNLDNIEEDLLLKQKFYQIVDESEGTHRFVLFKSPPSCPADVSVQCPNFDGGCAFDDPSACAFNVESIQFRPFDLEGGVNASPMAPCVEAIIVDGAFTDVSGKNICTPTNLLVDMGVGKIGAAMEVVVVLDAPFVGNVEWNGEKPQGMFLFAESEFVPLGP
jgi:hypothetical protein